VTIPTFLERHGLVALFLLATVEGDMSLVLAGILAHLGFMPVAGAVLCGALGNLTGDSGWYLVGRIHHGRIKNSRLYRRVGSRIEGIARRIGPWQLLAARVVYGTRNASMLFWGMMSLPLGRFLLMDGFGCFVASVGFVGLGYALGQGAESVMGNIRRVEHGLLVALLAGAVAVWLISRITRRRLEGRDPSV
jgi:membrane protein DedA with SNARE-associated domain